MIPASGGRHLYNPVHRNAVEVCGVSNPPTAKRLEDATLLMAHVVLYYHIVWRTKRSERTITEEYDRELYAYILGICEKKQCKLIRIGGVADHVHMLISIRPDIAVSDFMQVLKSETSKWMKTQPDKFPMFDGWGNGYAAFTYCERDKETIRHYIMNQKEHHRKHTFREEYEALLAKWGINPATDYFLRDE